MAAKRIVQCSGALEDLHVGTPSEANITNVMSLMTYFAKCASSRTGHILVDQEPPHLGDTPDFFRRKDTRGIA